MSVNIMQFNKLAFSLYALSVSFTAFSHSDISHSEINHNHHIDTKVQSTNNIVQTAAQTKKWLAGDHHIHSQYSVGWDKSQKPPAPIVGGDAIYPITKNAAMASKFGLSWMVTTDHGGPNHSKINREQAYPELLKSRKEVADVLQFYGLELNTPAGDHSSIIVPHSHDEADVLFDLESAFDTKESFPNDSSRHFEEKMIEALLAMQKLDKPPVVIAHHPSRSAKKYGEYGLYQPSELRRWNDVAPNIAIGMEGAPGHQAFALTNGRRGKDKTKLYRGNYRKYPTMGGFDQMTAKLGGFWDSMIGEGRHWWITANSDSHAHYTEGGVDFWPGEYSKTYVFADKNHESVLSGLRSGQVFVTTGDLISELYITASVDKQHAGIGGELNVKKGSKVKITIKLLDPKNANAAGDQPTVSRVDLIVGEVTGKQRNLNQHANASTRVEKRFTKQDWHVEGEYLLIDYELTVNASSYIRLRGTNTEELEPLKDTMGENPWDDLWFYANPIFIISSK